MFKAVYKLETIGEFLDLKQAWAVIKYLMVKDIERGEFQPMLLSTVWVDTPHKTYFFEELRDKFA